MKIKILKLSLIALLFSFISAGCQKEGEPITNRAKGEIILITGMCYGEAVIIEVDDPVGIGKEGSFSFVGDTNVIKYQNAVSVPVFSKIPEIPDSIIPKVGLYLDFEYRELTEQEKEAGLFKDTNLSHPCLAIYGPPNTKPYIITKVHNHY